jgi:predicted oxidoreductase
LQDLLQAHRDVRHVLPHLIHLEQTLARQGSRALIEVPVKVLQRAMDQLDTIEGGSQAAALLPLRLRVEEAVRQRSPVNLRGDIANVEVRETSVSQYDEAEDELTNRMALDEASNRVALDEIYARAGVVGEPAAAGK